MMLQSRYQAYRQMKTQPNERGRLSAIIAQFLVLQCPPAVRQNGGGQRHRTRPTPEDRRQSRYNTFGVRGLPRPNGSKTQSRHEVKLAVAHRVRSVRPIGAKPCCHCRTMWLCVGRDWKGFVGFFQGAGYLYS